MSKSDEPKDAPAPKIGPTPKHQRESKLAAALRANLKRRKAAERRPRR